MTYIENIFLCLALPLILSLIFTKGRVRSFTVFIITGMGVCLLSAYVSSFFMDYYGVSHIDASVEIAPVCEEVMKLLPLLLYFFIFEPEPRELPSAAIAIAAGFATFENVCYLTENGAENIFFLFTRGFSAGALHILCGILCGFGISFTFRHHWMALTGTLGLLGLCAGLHAVYNLLITAQGAWRLAGYLGPSLLIVGLFLLGKLTPSLRKSFEDSF